MSVTASERTGVVVIRAWIESGAPLLRARITAAYDLSTDEQTIAVAAGVEEIMAVVRVWLETFTT